MSLPYNKELLRFARKLRKAGNLAEALMWNQIKNRQFRNLDFDRQKVIGNYIVDFFCAGCGVVIEIDGYDSHDYDQDTTRDEFLSGLGLEVIRISYHDVRKNMPRVLDALYDHPAFNHPVCFTSFASIKVAATLIVRGSFSSRFLAKARCYAPSTEGNFHHPAFTLFSHPSTEGN